MKFEELNTISELSKFIDGAQKIIFTFNKTEKYNWVASQLIKFIYSKQVKKDKGVLISYLHKVAYYKKGCKRNVIMSALN